MRIIFDLDGTLADCEHRRHLVRKDRKDPMWQQFYQQCGKDTPIEHTIEVFRTLTWDGNHDVRIWSGRCESTRQITVGWLLDWVTAEAGRFQRGDWLRMRPIGNTDPDDVLKEAWLDMSIAAGWRPDLVFDDRNKVVAMWRRRGIPCFQVAPGDF